MLQRRLLLGHNFSKEPLVGCVKHETNDILLPEVSNPKSPDLETLEMIRNVVRVKRGMSIFCNNEERETQANGLEEQLIANNSDTKLKHELTTLEFEVQFNAPLIFFPSPKQLNAAEHDHDTNTGFGWLDLLLIQLYYMIMVHGFYNIFIWITHCINNSAK